ncbi:hypothetical protein ACI48D_17850 [Massilia sp. LXY-6]|uniref:hypothetical protein n=1 Tax=Massilia sp. LXY-6 TaxID=3379823 RepID=UPI003EE2B804
MSQLETIQDENLPVGGFEIAQQLKSIQQVNDTPIVALTSFYWVGIEAETANAGLTQYLPKPAPFDTLIYVLASLATLHGKKLPHVDVAEPSAISFQ